MGKNIFVVNAFHSLFRRKIKEPNDDFINCNTHNQPAKLILPDKENAFVVFKNHKNKFRCPFVIYADFESLL